MATDRAIRTAFEGARAGKTEREVGVALSSALITNRAEMQAFQVLAAGANTCSTHHRAGDYTLKRGDIMRTDFGGIFPGGYYSDLARTICIGRASSQVEEATDSQMTKRRSANDESNPKSNWPVVSCPFAIAYWLSCASPPAFEGMSGCPGPPR